LVNACVRELLRRDGASGERADPQLVELVAGVALRPV
jgi:hypothetical protein